MLGGPREMLSKDALEKGNWQSLCSTILVAKKKSRRRQELLCTLSSPIILDRAGGIALDHSRLGR